MTTPAGAPLTAREAEVLGLVSRRLSNAEIAEQLYVSVRTVESHVSALLRKIGAADRRELARAAGTMLPSTHASGPASSEGHVPALRTQLIGRSDCISAVASLTSQTRLITLIGPGGVGKTSIALSVAHRTASDWSDGVAFVDLIPTRTGLDVLNAVTRSLHLGSEAGQSLEALIEHLRDSSMLLVFDNCEHVIDEVAELLHVALSRTGAWHALATSREPLGLRDEHLIPVETLGVEAVELFVQRAHQAEPRVEWDPSDARIVEICQRLDGLPLALELAAGQLRRWGLDDLRRQLDRSLSHVGHTGRGNPRHQTMTDAIGWSYGLLDGAEQQLLRHLAVFPAQFDRAAAAALAPLLGDLDIDQNLGSLVDKSLVAHEPGTGSYRLLATIRSFAQERLDEEGERDAVFELHRRWQVGIAAANSRLQRWLSGSLAGVQCVGSTQLRQAFWASIDGGYFDDAAELAVSRSFLWRQATGCAEGHQWLDALSPGSVRPDMSAWLAIMRADIGQGEGDFEAMASHGDDAAYLATEPSALAVAEYFRSLRCLGDPEAADQALSELMQLAPDDSFGKVVKTFFLVAHLADPKRYDHEAQIEQLDRECSPDGYDRYILNWAAWMYGLAQRDATRASRHMSDQYEFLRYSGFPETWLISFSLALTKMVEGHGAMAQLANSLDVARREGYRIEGDTLLALAYAEACDNRPEIAAELLGLARTCRFNTTAHHVLHRVVIDPVIRSQLDPEAFDKAITRGRSRTVASTLAGYDARIRSPRSLVD